MLILKIILKIIFLYIILYQKKKDFKISQYNLTLEVVTKPL
jgi:hypothetical protein